VHHELLRCCKLISFQPGNILEAQTYSPQLTADVARWTSLVLVSLLFPTTVVSHLAPASSSKTLTSTLTNNDHGTPTSASRRRRTWKHCAHSVPSKLRGFPQGIGDRTPTNRVPSTLQPLRHGRRAAEGRGPDLCWVEHAFLGVVCPCTMPSCRGG
jgi:hypothetical protein